MDGKYLKSLWFMVAVTLTGLDVCRCSTVSVPPEPVTTTEGGVFKIKCGIAATSNIEGVRVKRIVKEDGITEETVYQSLPESWVDTEFDKTKYSLKSVGKLNVEITVKNVNFKDAGTYICEPQVIATNRATAAVLVLGEPLVTLPEITAGESFQATCEVQFMAPPDIIEGNSHFPELIGKVDDIEYEGTTKYTGGKPGTDINAKLETNMNITLTKSSNGHKFWCIARTITPSHEETSSKTLDIKFEVTQPVLPEKDVFYVGEVIRCQAQGNPTPTITWKPVKSKIKGTYQENLTIVDMMVGEPDEVWSCEARNDVKGRPVVKREEITFTAFRDNNVEVTQPVLPEKDVFYVGEVIRCQAQGNPTPTITWKPVKSKIKGTYQENLTIVDMMVGEPDEVWSCEARNDVKGRPVVKREEITFTAFRDNNGDPRLDGPDHPVIIGNDIQLRCDATHLHEKIKKLQWYLNGNAIGDVISDPTNQDFLYKISNVQRDDKGLYKCEVTGQAATGSDTYLLKVYCEC